MSWHKSDYFPSIREAEIQGLKSQLGRMREDWIEEECHRVEAQLALKEARKEIKQLRQVVDTMKNSLMEKDKGIQKYFIDINIQNRKLESLLHSMELAQSGANLHDEPTLDFICDSPQKPCEEKQKEQLQVEDQAEQVMADSGLLANDEMTNQMDMLEQVLMSTAVDYSQDGSAKLISRPGLSTLMDSAAGNSKVQLQSQTTADEQQTSGEKAVQTDETFYNLDLQALLLHLMKLQTTGMSSSVFQKLPKAHDPNLSEAEEPLKNNWSKTPNSNLIEGMDYIPNNPAPSTLLVPQDSGGSTQSLEPEVDPGLTKEMNFGITCSNANIAGMGKSYLSNSYLVDLVAVAAPILPMVAWLYSQNNAADGQPVYNMAAIIRGCCIMGLHSLRLVTYGPHV